MIRPFVAGALALLVANLGGAASLTVSATSCAPGEDLVVGYHAPEAGEDSWVGIVPSAVRHGHADDADAHDVDYQYLEEGSSGTLTFAAPNRAGSWDLRLLDGPTGRELASVTFQVRPPVGAAKLELERSQVAAGDHFAVRFVTPEDLPTNAWLGLLPSDVPHGAEADADGRHLDYYYLEGERSGVRDFMAPAEPGSYDIRLYDTDDDGTELTSVSFTVGTALAAEEMARRLDEDGRLQLYGIRFATDSATLDATSRETLAAIAELLETDPELVLRIVGHTDATGGREHNLDLSRRRAAAVKQELAAAHGIDAERLQTEGLGPDEPVADNGTEGGRALNRRVELVRE